MNIKINTNNSININIKDTIDIQPTVSLFTVFWARAAPKHRHLQPFGRPVLPNTIIYATFALS